MWSALIWAFIIGWAAEADGTGMSAGILAFIAIGYFAWKSNEVAKVSDSTIAVLRSKIQDLEVLIAHLKNAQETEEEPDPMKPGYEAHLDYLREKRSRYMG